MSKRIMLTLEPNQLKALQTRATLEGKTVTAYAKHLVLTHPKSRSAPELTDLREFVVVGVAFHRDDYEAMCDWVYPTRRALHDFIGTAVERLIAAEQAASNAERSMHPATLRRRRPPERS